MLDHELEHFRDNHWVGRLQRQSILPSAATLAVRSTLVREAVAGHQDGTLVTSVILEADRAASRDSVNRSLDMFPVRGLLSNAEE